MEPERTSPDPLAARLQALAADDKGRADPPAALWEAVRAQTIDARPTMRARMQEMPTRLRILTALALALVLGTVVALACGVRSDLGTVAIMRYGVAMGGLVLLALAAFSVSLRGAHQRPVGAWTWAVTGLTLVLPIALALLPSIWGPTDADWSHIGASACHGVGLVTGALVSVPIFLMQRASAPVFARVCAAVAGGGVIAFAMLAVHCPSNDVTHLLIGHAAVGAVLVAIAAVVVWVRRRRA